jgi:hypothetical protein
LKSQFYSIDEFQDWVELNDFKLSQLTLVVFCSSYNLYPNIITIKYTDSVTGASRIVNFDFNSRKWEASAEVGSSPHSKFRDIELWYEYFTESQIESITHTYYEHNAYFGRTSIDPAAYEVVVSQLEERYSEFTSTVSSFIKVTPDELKLTEEEGEGSDDMK